MRDWSFKHPRLSYTWTCQACRFTQSSSAGHFAQTASLCCRTIRPNSAVRSIFKASGCSDNPNHHVNYLEHVVVRITITHPRRGDLAIYLTSPSGTRSQLLANRYGHGPWPPVCTQLLIKLEKEWRISSSSFFFFTFYEVEGCACTNIIKSWFFIQFLKITFH